MVSVFTILVVAIGVVIAAAAASSHGSAATTGTTVLIGFGLVIVLGFAIAGFVLNGRSKRVQESLR